MSKGEKVRLALGAPFVLLGLGVMWLGVWLGGERMASIVYDSMKERIT